MSTETQTPAGFMAGSAGEDLATDEFDFSTSPVVFNRQHGDAGLQPVVLEPIDRVAPSGRTAQDYYKPSMPAAAPVAEYQNRSEVTTMQAPRESIAEMSITESTIADAAITKGAIADAAVTEASIVDAEVTEDVDAEVTEDVIADAAITKATIGEAVVDDPFDGVDYVDPAEDDDPFADAAPAR